MKREITCPLIILAGSYNSKSTIITSSSITLVRWIHKWKYLSHSTLKHQATVSSAEQQHITVLAEWQRTIFTATIILLLQTRQQRALIWHWDIQNECEAQKCLLRESNTGPSDLQSDALPTELSRQFGMCISGSYSVLLVLFFTFGNKT